MISSTSLSHDASIWIGILTLAGAATWLSAKTVLLDGSSSDTIGAGFCCFVLGLVAQEPVAGLLGLGILLAGLQSHYRLQIRVIWDITGGQKYPLVAMLSASIVASAASAYLYATGHQSQIELIGFFVGGGSLILLAVGKILFPWPDQVSRRSAMSGIAASLTLGFYVSDPRATLFVVLGIILAADVVGMLRPSKKHRARFGNTTFARSPLATPEAAGDIIKNAEEAARSMAYHAFDGRDA